MSHERRQRRALRQSKLSEFSDLRKEIDSQQEQYAGNWENGHAAHHETHGDYHWMASFITGYKRVLEIGCGCGNGTIALCKQGSTVIGIEQNPFCVKRAVQSLREADIPVVQQPRGTIEINSSNSYRVSYPEVNRKYPTEGALLIGGDILKDADPRLADWLTEKAAPFDAVVCWVIGTQQSRYLALGEGPKAYRLLIQNCVYEIADVVLRSGGILHIVDRAGNPANHQADVAAEILEIHREQASVTSLTVDAASLTTRPYVPPPAGTGIKVGAYDNVGTFVENEEMVFWSIIARKPSVL